jgi:ABC-2 type transport system permease protein
MKSLTIANKELKSYFNSPSAYIVGFVFLLIAGWFFVSNLFLVGLANLRTVIELMPFLFLFFIPAITMGSFAEEKKQGTIELLFTMPLTDWELILGKFFSALFLTLIILLFTISYPITLIFLGNPDIGQIIAQYIGVMLLAASYISIGVAISSFTSSQVISFIITFLILFFFFIVDKFLIFLPDTLANILHQIAVMPHFNNIIKGVIDSSDIVYFFSIIVAFLFFTLYSLERRHWNG